ncbi:hypothetical protein PPUJ20028_05270 [Pseudomonas putida]|uniref:Uncharacterized protein n=1 Tax=Pseudomonas putida TaxID=303 RepID=A0AA37VS50_PSEPU|nr:hypothetical protein [Pseudomonas putida]GLO11946.1 hypothetical protein PPUJ20028_05270 [Pseudomonas putida]GLO34082.1 hypothetical protein PPUN14671_09150 [Pseudomonas putida]HDS0965553.1 hypothetical protein [Pseudomonas putida]HDS0992254.1 hypothetical protein [Pseudomonas putida]
MRYPRFLAALLFIGINGCVQYHPLPVDEKNIEPSLNEDNTIHGLPAAPDQTGAISNLNKHSDWHLKKPAHLKKHQPSLGDTSLGLGVFSLIAGGAAAGALLASDSTIQSDRHQITVHVSNHEKPSDTMSCMHDYLIPLQSNLNTVPSTHFINVKIKETRLRLRNAQTSITLPTPDLEQLERTFKEAANQKSTLVSTSSNLLSRRAIKSDAERKEIKPAEKELTDYMPALIK